MAGGGWVDTEVTGAAALQWSESQRNNITGRHDFPEFRDEFWSARFQPLHKGIDSREELLKYRRQPVSGMFSPCVSPSLLLSRRSCPPCGILGQIEADCFSAASNCPNSPACFRCNGHPAGGSHPARRLHPRAKSPRRSIRCSPYGRIENCNPRSMRGFGWASTLDSCQRGLTLID